MIEKISFGVSETTDTGQNQKDVFNPDIESLSISEKSIEVISIAIGATDFALDFGSAITAPALIILHSDKDLEVTFTDGVNSITLSMQANETYRLPLGVTGIAVTNSTGEAASLTKIVGA
jgi:hypothetical protein